MVIKKPGILIDPGKFCLIGMIPELLRRVASNELEGLAYFAEISKHLLTFFRSIIAVALNVEVITPFFIFKRACVQETDVEAVAADSIDSLDKCTLHILDCEDHHEA